MINATEARLSKRLALIAIERHTIVRNISGPRELNDFIQRLPARETLTQ
ncbi:MAG TPA: hypothetical protein VK581_03210 [Chthoniobacterales bacterium]|nr:hypothetical protein [Chthoniobacterales bacterium]